MTTRFPQVAKCLQLGGWMVSKGVDADRMHKSQCTGFDVDAMSGRGGGGPEQESSEASLVTVQKVFVEGL